METNEVESDGFLIHCLRLVFITKQTPEACDTWWHIVETCASLMISPFSNPTSGYMGRKKNVSI